VSEKLKPCPACGCWLNTSEYVPAEAAWNTRSDAHLLRSHEALREALRRIEQWEMPETGRVWDDGTPMSYSAAFGSNGERDVIRGIARAALTEAAALEKKL